MSIETEKWSYDEDEDVLRDATSGEPVPLYAHRKAAQVLPEALALLKEMLGAGGDSDSTTLQPDHEERTRDILRRAGVLK